MNLVNPNGPNSVCFDRRPPFRGLRVGLFVLVSLSAGCASSAKKITWTESPWEHGPVTGTRYNTEHFEIYTTVSDIAWREALPGYLEDCHRHYRALIPNATWASARLETYIFETREQWERFTRQRYPTRAATYEMIRAGGYSEGTAAVCYLLDDRGQTLAVLAHEGMHQFLAAGGQAGIPAWLNEGLASYCERPLHSISGKSWDGLNVYRINDLRAAVAAKQLIPLNELLSADAGSVILQRDAQLTRAYYAQSYALVAYLREGENGRYCQAFEDMLRDIGTGSLLARGRAEMIGSRTESFGEAVFKAYIAEDPTVLGEEYKDYCLRLAGLGSYEGS